MSINPQTTQDQGEALRSKAQASLWRLAGPWWLFLLTGIAWLIISWVVLRFTPASITTVGVLLGVLFLLAAVNEFMIAAVGHSWRWAHVLMGTSSSPQRSGHSPVPSTRSGLWPRPSGCC
jgi:uncharacterized membrane protein HdeD (DUF308 family)